MAINPIALKAYNAASQMLHQQPEKAKAATSKEPTRSFADTIEASLSKVNSMQLDKAHMVEEFAAGKSQNVHELMISIQKAGLAVDMTSAVRNKVLSAYQELMRIQF